jgi:cell division protein FtsB
MRRLTVVLSVLAAIAALGLLSSIVTQGFAEVAEAETERRQLEAEKAHLERRIESFTATRDALLTSDAAVEAVARRELGMVRPGERVILLTTPTPPPRPTALTQEQSSPILTLPD